MVNLYILIASKASPAARKYVAQRKTDDARRSLMQHVLTSDPNFHQIKAEIEGKQALYQTQQYKVITFRRINVGREINYSLGMLDKENKPKSLDVLTEARNIEILRHAQSQAK